MAKWFIGEQVFDSTQTMSSTLREEPSGSDSNESLSNGFILLNTPKGDLHPRSTNLSLSKSKLKLELKKPRTGFSLLLGLRLKTYNLRPIMSETLTQQPEDFRPPELDATKKSRWKMNMN